MNHGSRNKTRQPQKQKQAALTEDEPNSASLDNNQTTEYFDPSLSLAPEQDPNPGQWFSPTPFDLATQYHDVLPGTYVGFQDDNLDPLSYAGSSSYTPNRVRPLHGNPRGPEKLRDVSDDDHAYEKDQEHQEHQSDDVDAYEKDQEHPIEYPHAREENLEYQNDDGHAYEKDQEYLIENDHSQMSTSSRVDPSSTYQIGKVIKVYEKQRVRKNHTEEYRTYGRRYIVVDTNLRGYTCIPIHTYGHEGCTSKRQFKNHGVIYQPPSSPLLNAKEGASHLGIDPVRLEIELADETLHWTARVNYSELVEINHESNVLFIGRIYEEDLDILKSYFIKNWENNSKKHHHHKPHHKHKGSSNRSSLAIRGSRTEASGSESGPSKDNTVPKTASPIPSIPEHPISQSTYSQSTTSGVAGMVNRDASQITSIHTEANEEWVSCNEIKNSIARGLGYDSSLSLKQDTDSNLIVDLMASWEVSRFWSQEVPGTSSSKETGFRNLLMLVGTPRMVHAVTCEKFISSTWGSCGIELLNGVIRALQTTKSSVSIEDVGSVLQVDIQTTENIQEDLCDTRIELRGSPKRILDAMSQLAWLGSACRLSDARGLASSTVRFNSSRRPRGRNRYCDLQLQPLQPVITTSEHCWHKLFGPALIVADFNVRTRTEGIGLQIPLQLMATLAQVSVVTTYDDGLILVGHSIVLFPARMLQDGVQWHCVSAKDIQAAVEVIRLCGDRVKGKEMNELSNLTTYLGHYDKARVNLGTLELVEMAVSPSGLSNPSAKMELNREFTLGSVFYMAPAITSITPHDEMDIIKKPRALLYDSETGTAWLVSQLSVALHVVLHFLRDPDTADRLRGVQPLITYAKPLADRGEAAMAMIMENSDLELYKDERQEAVKFWGVVDVFLKDFISIRNARAIRRSESGFRISTRKPSLHGWDFSDLVKKRLRIHERQLNSPHCPWWSISRQPDIITLFGGNFGQVIAPVPGPWLSPAWHTVAEKSALLVKTQITFSGILTDWILSLKSGRLTKLVKAISADGFEQKTCVWSMWRIREWNKLRTTITMAGSSSYTIAIVLASTVLNRNISSLNERKKRGGRKEDVELHFSSVRGEKCDQNGISEDR
ncbi:hypothetical protein SCARD494_03126 [Seiridium cardinale]